MVISTVKKNIYFLPPVRDHLSVQLQYLQLPRCISSAVFSGLLIELIFSKVISILLVLTYQIVVKKMEAKHFHVLHFSYFLWGFITLQVVVPKITGVILLHESRSPTFIRALFSSAASSTHFQLPALNCFRMRRTPGGIYRCIDQFAKEPVSQRRL